MTGAGDASRASAIGRSRFLVAMFQGGGNIPLIVPVLARLAARGHDVRVIAGPGVRASRIPVSDRMLERITEAGARIVPFEMPAVHPLDEAPPIRGVAGGWIPRVIRTRLVGDVVPAAWSSAWAENVSAELRREPADAVLADFVLLGALAAAEAAGIPSAALVHNASVAFAHSSCRRPVTDLPPIGLGYSPARGAAGSARAAFWRAVSRRVRARNARPALNQARAALSLSTLHDHCDQFDTAARVLILGPEAFDFPVRRLPANVRYVGTPFDDADAPAWEPPWPTDDLRPLVLVSLSTLNQGQEDVMRRILSAVWPLPVRVLVTLGPALASRPFDAPENVRLEPFVPHSAVLPWVAAMVTQCGLGTLMKALAHGVPLICVPVLGDQPDNAARIAFHGAGVRLGPDAPAQEIAATIERVLAEPSFGAAARRLGAAIAGADAAETAADELESLVAHNPR